MACQATYKRRRWFLSLVLPLSCQTGPVVSFALRGLRKRDREGTGQIEKMAKWRSCLVAGRCSPATGNTDRAANKHFGENCRWGDDDAQLA